jgi:hypothetical protein
MQSPIYYEPESREELEKNGFKLTYARPSVKNGGFFYDKVFNDTAVNLFYPEQSDDEFVKTITYMRKIFDSVALFKYFKTIDKNYTDTSTILRVEKGVNKVISYEVYKLPNRIVIAYSSQKYKQKQEGFENSSVIDSVNH